jgi:hypothetical protein
MPKYNEELTSVWFAYRFYLSEISRHERDISHHKENPQDHLRNSGRHLALAKYRSAKWLVKFIHLVREIDGFVYVDRHVYVDGRQGVMR